MKIEEILTSIAEISKEHGAKEVILYGSRAKNTAHKRSDIDIAIKGVRDFDTMEEEIQEIPTLYTIDVLNFDTCTNPLLIEDIKQYGRKIY
jgi:predicted nucleotidyltransferase